MATVAPETPPEAVPLNDPPTDGVTALQYLNQSSSSSSQLLASTSWDGAVRVHDTSSKSVVVSHSMSCPLLSLAVDSGVDPASSESGSSSNSNKSVLFVGGLDGSVRSFDVATSTESLVGSHAPDGSAVTDQKFGCSTLNMCSGGASSNLLASASWSRSLCLWDVRQPASKAVATLSLPGKAFSMDYDQVYNRLVVATSGRRMVFVDVTSRTIVMDRESSLKYQTRCVSFRKDGLGVAVGSIEGRVGMEFLDDLGTEAPMKPYAFKCHRVKTSVFPVNCIAFHPRLHGTFATGGCDGTVVLWDGNNKKKLSALPALPTSIAALAMSGDGSEIAMASSYTFEEGDREHPKDEIYVRRLLDSECQPKKSKPKE